MRNIKPSHQQRGEELPPGGNREEPIAEKSIPALTLTLFSIVHGRMYGSERTGEADFCLKAVEIIRKYCKANAQKLPFELDEGTDMTEDIKYFNDRALNSWMNMEWHQNVPSFEEAGASAERDDEGASDEELPSLKRPAKTPLRRKEKHGRVEDDDLGTAGLLPGLGTMFQPAIDWLSDEKRADYTRWKKDMLHQAALIEQNA